MAGSNASCHAPSRAGGRGGRRRRDRLLAAAIAQAESHGVGDLSPRELAAAIGTSHRMLIYHFGSKEDLVGALVHAVEAAQRAFLAQLFADQALGRAEAVRKMWRRLADPGLHPQERLFSPPDVARADARLAVAVGRGLLLDLLATGDRQRVDEALERYIQLRHPSGA